MENSSKIFSRIFIFRVVTQAVLLKNSSIFFKISILGRHTDRFTRKLIHSNSLTETIYNICMICITPSWSRQGILGISDFSCSTFSIGPWMISYSLRNVDPWLISSWIESMFWGIFEEWRGSYSLQFKMNVQDHPSASVYWIQHHPACNYDYESRFGRYRFYTNIDFWRIQNFFFGKIEQILLEGDHWERWEFYFCSFEDFKLWSWKTSVQVA